MGSKDLSASDFMARTSELLSRSSEEPALAASATPTCGSLAQRTDDLLARTAALLGKPIPSTAVPTTPMPVAESVMCSTECYGTTTATPAAGSFAQRSSDLLARTAQLLGKPMSSENIGAVDVAQYAMSPQPTRSFAPPAANVPPAAMPVPGPAGEGSFAQRSADLLARTAALLGRPQPGEAGGYEAVAPPPFALMTAPPVMESMPPPMFAPAGGAPQSGSLSKRADDLLARTAALLGNKTPSSGARTFDQPAAAPLQSSVSPSVEASLQHLASGSVGGGNSGSLADRSDELLARTAQLLGRNPCAGAPAPMMHTAAEVPATPPTSDSGGNFAQRSSDVLARTAQLLNKTQTPAPKLELLEMLRRAPPVGDSTA